MKIDYSKYVPVQFYHLNLYKFQEQGGFDRESRSIERQLREKFDGCLKNDLVFSFDSYFDDKVGFAISTIGSHFSQLYKKIFSKHGKNFATFVNNVKHGKKLAKALELSGEFTVIDVCGKYKFSIGYINRMLNESKKPVIMISCGRYLTGVTLKRLHGTILMGTCNSAVSYIQFGLRGKNTYEGREYPCTIFDLNTYSFLMTDAFKEMIVGKTEFTGQTIEDTLKDEYNQNVFEIFELNDFNNFEQILNFDEELQKNWMISEDGYSMSSLIINEETIPQNYYKELFELGITLNEFTVENCKVLITEKQCDKPSKTKQNKNKFNNEPLKKETDYKLWLAKLIAIMNSIPLYIHPYGFSSLDQIIEMNPLEFDSFCPHGIEVLKTLKKVWIEHNDENRWKNLNDAIFTIAKRYED